MCKTLGQDPHVDRHRFDANPDPESDRHQNINSVEDRHQNDADPKHCFYQLYEEESKLTIVPFLLEHSGTNLFLAKLLLINARVTLKVLTDHSN